VYSPECDQLPSPLAGLIARSAKLSQAAAVSELQKLCQWQKCNQNKLLDFIVPAGSGQKAPPTRRD
jgi:hypothetical protein